LELSNAGESAWNAVPRRAFAIATGWALRQLAEFGQQSAQLGYGYHMPEH